MQPSVEPATVAIPANLTNPKRKRLLLKWSLILTGLVLAYFTWQCGSGMHAAAQLSDQAVRTFHSELDSAAYENIFRDSDAAFQNAGSHEQLIKFLAGVHSKLGASRSFSRRSIFVNATTNGTFVKVEYASVLSRGVLMRSSRGAGKVAASSSSATT